MLKKNPKQIFFDSPAHQSKIRLTVGPFNNKNVEKHAPFLYPQLETHMLANPN